MRDGAAERGIGEFHSQSICITCGFCFFLQKLQSLPREFCSQGRRKENSEFPPKGVDKERTAAAAAAAAAQRSLKGTRA